MVKTATVDPPVLFNPAQLATWKQAEKLAKQIANFRQQTGAFMAGGVAPETKDPNTSGIYIPSWGGPFQTPSIPAQGLYWIHFRFNNGVSGINVGLILDKIKRYNGNTAYVFGSLSADLQSQ